MPWRRLLREAIGAPEGAVTVYRLLLDETAASVEELADRAHMPANTITEHMSWLRERGLVLRANRLALDGDVQRYAAADPAHALREQIWERERSLHELQKTLPELQRIYRRARRPGAHETIQHLEGWENVGNRYHQMLRDAATEVMLWEHGPYTPGPAPTEESILRRGVQFRILCDPAEFPAQLAVEFAALTGLEARLAPGIPFRGIVVDRQLGLIMMDREAQNRTALVANASLLVDGLVELFDLQWRTALPVEAQNASVLDDHEHHVLRLLAAGLKDDAIARQLNTTTRTVRRKVQAVLTALGARSRFHAGVEARRRGWV